MVAVSATRCTWLQLQPRPDYLDHADPAWLSQAIQDGIVCGECKYRHPRAVGEPLSIRLHEKPYARPFGNASVCLVAQRAFVDALHHLGPDLLLGLTPGTLILPNGKTSEKYVTLSPVSVVAIRGGLQSGSGNRCGTCRRYRYFPMPWESRHLVKGTFDESRRLHATGLSVLVVRADIWEHIPDVFKKKIRAWPLPVKNEAEDGMHYFPPLWP